MNGAAIAGLNLGSRNRAIPGFLNMDCDQHEGVDIVGDISDLSRFADCSVPAIYASHCLEHFPHTKTDSVLREWLRVLSPGGVLCVGVPDFKRAIELYLSEPRGLSPWFVNFLWGDQGYATAFHYAGFDEHLLREKLLSAGFKEASRVENFPIGDKNDCSRSVSTRDRKPVSLNFMAVK